MEYMSTNQQDTLMKKAYIGLDVHKASIVIAVALEGRSEPENYGKSSSDSVGDSVGSSLHISH